MLLSDLNGINTEISTAAPLTQHEMNMKAFHTDDAEQRLHFELAVSRLIDVPASEVVIKDLWVTSEGVLEKRMCTSNPVSARSHRMPKLSEQLRISAKCSYSGQIFFQRNVEGRMEGKHTEMISERIVKNSCGHWK